MPMNNRLLVPRQSYDPAAAAYIAAVQAADGQALESGVKTAIDRFVRGCKADGIWTAIKASCFLAGPRTLAGCMVPLVGPTPSNQGPFVSDDYLRKTGWIGNSATKYINTGRNNNADPKDSHHLAAYVTELDSNGAAIGVWAGSGSAGVAGSTMLVERGSTPGALRGRSRSATLASASANEATGLLGVARSNSANHVLRSGGTTSTHTLASDTPAAGNVFIFATNNAETPANYTNGRAAFYSIGEFLDLSLLDARITAYMAAIGAAIP